MAGITAIYISATSFSVIGDQTTVFNIGRRVRATCSDVYKYGTIESSAYTSLTTVVLTATSDDLNSGLTEVYYGIQADSIGSLPTHAHDATEGEGGTIPITNLSDTPAVYDTGKFLKSTTSGTEWASGGGGTLVHSELNNLDYASAGHTGFSETAHIHTESDVTDLDKYTESEVNTISGSLNTKIDGKADTVHTHDDRYYTESEVDTISGTLSSEIDSDIATHTSNSDAHHAESHTVASHSDTTATGANLNELVGSGDTILHKHDTLYYTEAEVDTISGSLQTNIDADKSADEVVVEVINTPTFDSMQDWFNNTQSAGRMHGGDTSAHTDAITGVTVSGVGSGEFKVAGDQTAYFTAALSIHITGSTNNNGYFTVSSGVSYSGGTTTIPVDEAVAVVADGNIYNGRVDISEGTGILKVTDSDIGVTKSFDLHADTNIELTDLNTNYVYVDYNAGTPDIKVTTDRDSIEYNRQFPLGMIYRNGPRTWSCSCGINLPNYTRLNHERLLNTRGYERASGGEISEAGTRNIESTAGIFYRGSDRVDTVTKASATDKMTTVYYNGSSWVWTENETQIDNTYYNNIASGLVELGVSKYAVHWACIDYLSNLYVVYGRGSYSLAEAQLASVPSLMPVVAINFGIVAAKIIIQKTAASFTEVISAYTQLIPSATPATHNDLSGLNDGDYKHLTAANFNDLTDGDDCSIHKHDDIYYTEAEVDTISGSLNTKITAKPDTLLELSDTPAAYDNNKYLKSTTSGFVLATVSGGDGTSVHSELSNLDYASAGHTGFQPAGDYATDSELTSVSGVLQTNIDGKADTVHTHDDRYYTETEVDTISGSLNTKIDTKADSGANSDITSMTGLDDDGIPGAKIVAATSTAEGVSELAIASEINTGTDAVRTITPDALAGSSLGTKNVVVKCIADDTDLTTGDGKAYFTVPIELNGMNLVSVGAHVYTVSSSGLPTFQIHNLTDTVDILSTVITIDANEKDSKDAATPAEIDTANDGVATGDELRFDCDVAGTGTKGFEIRTGFRLP